MLTAATAMPATAIQKLSISTATPTIAAAAAAQLEGSIDLSVTNFNIIILLFVMPVRQAKPHPFAWRFLYTWQSHRYLPEDRGALDGD